MALSALEHDGLDDNLSEKPADMMHFLCTRLALNSPAVARPAERALTRSRRPRGREHRLTMGRRCRSVHARFRQISWTTSPAVPRQT
jgi:hypothetical protein